MRDQPIYITVDSVIFFTDNSGKYILLIQRNNDPFKSRWALPGGFLEEKETLEEGARRELLEETGIQINSMKEIGIFADPERDPRGRVISIAFAGFAETKEELKAGDDAGAAEWFELKDLPQLAFDHLEIIETAIKKF